MEIERLDRLSAALRNALETFAPDDVRVELQLLHLAAALNDARTVLLIASGYGFACGLVGVDPNALNEAIRSGEAIVARFQNEAQGERSRRSVLPWLSQAFRRAASEVTALDRLVEGSPLPPDTRAALRMQAEGILLMISAYTEAP